LGLASHFQRETMHLEMEDEMVTPPASPDTALSCPSITFWHPQGHAKTLLTLNIWGTWSFGDGIPIMKSMSTMMTMVRKTAKSLTVDRTWGKKPELKGASQTRP